MLYLRLCFIVMTMADEERPKCPICGEPMYWAGAGWICRYTHRNG
jgi:tRNA(Ile2) C34 agmatinyltransferase TiaS